MIILAMIVFNNHILAVINDRILLRLDWGFRLILASRLLFRG